MSFVKSLMAQGSATFYKVSVNSSQLLFWCWDDCARSCGDWQEAITFPGVGGSTGSSAAETWAIPGSLASAVPVADSMFWLVSFVF